MTKTTPYFVTYKAYDERGRRLAIFGRKVYTDELEIFILKCSTKDSFFKKKARAVYEAWLDCAPDLKKIVDGKYHPRVYTLPLGDPNRIRKRFNDHVHENYCKVEQHMDIVINDMLVDPTGKSLKAMGRNKTAELALHEYVDALDEDYFD